MKTITKNFFLFLFPLILIYGCSNNTVRDYTTLKQKALEIPPEFELAPPVEGTANNEVEDEIIVVSEDVETILGETMSDERPENNAQNQSLNEFIDQNFVAKKDSETLETPEEIKPEEIKDEQTMVEDDVINNSTNELTIDTTEVEDQNIIETEIVEEVDVQEDNNNETFSEEQFIENLSNTDEITSLPEEEQLKPEIMDDSIYDDTPTFSSDDELNDLLNRVDDLLSTYSD